jgi:hypothetical protein
MKSIDDAEELIYFVQDIFNVTDISCHKLIVDALINTFYGPFVISSLFEPKPALQINTCLYLLTQTIANVESLT